jgi:Arc/MetJ-type ribon-helix-helix transcriptional regulator
MQGRTIRMRLNQQQLELIDRTVAQGAAPSREALVILALRELAAKRRAERTKEGGGRS